MMFYTPSQDSFICFKAVSPGMLEETRVLGLIHLPLASELTNLFTIGSAQVALESRL